VSTSASAARRDAAELLRLAGVSSPDHDASWLLASVLDVSRSELALVSHLNEDQQRAFAELVRRRTAREPLQHILSEAWFRHLTLHVGPGVFVPRPETEVLVELALEFLADAPDTPRPSIADLCTGSAVVALSIATEQPGVDVHAVELSSDALPWAYRNLDAHEPDLARVDSTVSLHAGDATSCAEGLLRAFVGKVDIVTCNPPYIPDGAIPRDPEVREFDPAMALFGGPDGLAVVREIVGQAAQLLRPGGLLLIEHGDEQGDSANDAGLPALLRESTYFSHVKDHRDLAGRPRVTSGLRTFPTH
jgi:release factor glutamine methyltransferase